MAELAQIKAEKRVMLTQRIHKIHQLSIQANGAGIAHCFTNICGHVDTFEAYVQPTDQTYLEGVPQIYLSRVSVRLSPYDWEDLPSVEDWFATEVAKLNQHIDYLESILAAGEPVLCQEEVGGAA